MVASRKVFSLEGKGLKLNTAADIEPHIASLKADGHVEEVWLSGNTLGIGACEALADALKNKKNLKVAELADIFTGRLREEIPLALTALGAALLTCENLHTVNLSDNAFGLLAEIPLVTFLSQHGPLQHLYLNNNGLGPFCATSVARSLTKLAELKKTNSKFSPLETVICGRNRCENGSMEAWAEAYKANTGVKTVKMVQNGIRPEGIAILIKNGLSNCTGLETLDLQDNTFTSSGSEALAKAVVRWEKMVELGVGDCLLGKKCSKVAKALSEGKNKGLKVLRLQYNEIDVNGAKEFKHALEKALPVLEKLELNGNKFSEDDEVVLEIKDIFARRGFGGLDELDDMEEDSDEEEEEEKEVEDVVRRAKEEEEQDVALEKDKAVDDLADLLAAV
ncbi:hypothetical protein BGX38DRAFT_1092443 [Terfezia claveryi]|nr:hypothetical protein BGX38DRAFT_1092443 [Terfezia claveryi]